MGSSQALKRGSGGREVGRHHAYPSIPVPVADITNQASGIWQTLLIKVTLPSPAEPRPDHGSWDRLRLKHLTIQLPTLV